MDLNCLYFQHQISLMRASSSRNGHARARYQADAADLASRIGQFQRHAGAGAARMSDASGFTNPALATGSAEQ